jgi:hypothetical protein
MSPPAQRAITPEMPMRPWLVTHPSTARSATPNTMSAAPARFIGTTEKPKRERMRAERVAG